MKNRSQDVINLLRAIADVLEGTGKVEEIMRETNPIKVRGLRPDKLIIDEVVDTTGEDNPILEETKRVVKERLAGECKKCIRVAAGGDKRGRHSNGCRYANGPVTETIVKEPPEEIPLEGVVAEYRSRCCQERVIQKGSTLECFKCGNRTEPYQPKPPEKKWFDCDGCGALFEADTSDVVHCTQCGGSDVWPKNV